MPHLWKEQAGNTANLLWLPVLLLFHSSFPVNHTFGSSLCDWAIPKYPSTRKATTAFASAEPGARTPPALLNQQQGSSTGRAAPTAATARTNPVKAAQ